MNQQHKCPWPFCMARVDADLWGCKKHWFSLPPSLRKALWLAYTPGQTVATASQAYRHAAAAIDSWIVLHLQTGAPIVQPPPHKRLPDCDPQGDLPL